MSLRCRRVSWSRTESGVSSVTRSVPQMLQSQLESDRVRCQLSDSDVPQMLQNQLESDRVRCQLSDSDVPQMLQNQLESDRVRCQLSDSDVPQMLQSAGVGPSEVLAQ